MIAIYQKAAFFGLAALLGADQTAGPQVMLSQPVVAGMIGGLVVGQPILGALIGVAAQLAWNGAAPVGSLPNPDVSGGVLAGILTTGRLSEHVGPGRAILAGLAVTLLAGWAGSAIILLNRRLNARWTPWVLAAHGPARHRRAQQATGRAWLLTGTLSGTWVLVAAALGSRLAHLLLGWLPVSTGNMSVWYPFGWGLGLAGCVLAFWKDRARDWAWILGGALAAGALKVAGAY